MASGLSDGFVYAPKPPAAPAANIRVSVPPYNKSEYRNGGEVVMFNIPSGKRGQYLNTRQSYMTFDVEIETKTSSQDAIPLLALDGGAHCFFSNLETYHGSNLLEQIREYNSLYQLMSDIGEDTDHLGFSRNVAEGTANRNSSIFKDGAERNETEFNNTFNDLGQVVSGFWGALDTTGDTSCSAVKSQHALPFIKSSSKASVMYAHDGSVKTRHTFCIPIMSGIIGAQMSKYIPVGALATDLRAEWTLAPFEQALKAFAYINKSDNARADDATVAINSSPSALIAGAANGLKDVKIELSNFEMHLEYIELAADVQMAVEAASGGGYIMSFDSWYNYVNSIKANAGAVTQLIGARFSSIKTAYTLFRDQFAIGRLSHSSVTSRVNPFSVTPNRYQTIKNGSSFAKGRYDSGVGWFYTIGATHYPPKPVASDEEAYMEAVKSQHAVVSQNATGSISRRSWTISARRDAGDGSSFDTPPKTPSDYPMQGGDFYCTQNFESQSHKSHLAESGVNTLAQSMYLQARFPQSQVVPGVKKQTATNTASSNGAISGVNTVKDGLAADGTTADANTVWADWHQANAALQLDTFVHYDGIMIIENGIINTRF